MSMERKTGTWEARVAENGGMATIRKPPQARGMARERATSRAPKARSLVVRNELTPNVVVSSFYYREYSLVNCKDS
jgi:hypothetical protein